MHTERTIRIVASAAGGGNDVVAHLIARGLAHVLNEPVVVDNKDGKGSAAETVARAQPDGRTLLLFGSSLWLAPLMHDRMSHDPVKDFSPVILAARAPNVLVVHKSVAADSVAELIVAIKDSPEQIKCAYSVPGGSPHLAAALFKAMAGIALRCEVYNDVAAVFADLVAGRVQMMFANAAAAKLHLGSTSLKALAVTSDGPSSLFPALPTVASTVPGCVSGAVFAVLAPAKTPSATVIKLNTSIAQALREPEVQRQLSGIGIDIVAGPPEQLAALIESDVRRMRSVLADVDVR